jgi:hypothetical protein
MGAIIMVNGTLTVCSGIASTTLWFNNYDCRCRRQQERPRPLLGPRPGRLRERCLPSDPKLGAPALEPAPAALAAGLASAVLPGTGRR